MRKSGLFLLCGAAMALAALAVPASASLEDGAMAPATVSFDLAAPTALPTPDFAPIYLDTPSTSSGSLDSLPATAAMRVAALAVASDPARSTRAPQRLLELDVEVFSAEGVPKGET